MKKTYYNLYLITEDGEEEFLAKVKSRKLAMRTKMLYNIIYECRGRVVIR